MSNFTETILSQTLDINLSKEEMQTQNLSTLCTDLFLIIIKMREVDDLGETAALRKLITYYINQLENNCLRAGLTPETITLVKYALIATLDETVLSVPGEARDFWITNPMQLEIFHDNIAGEEFYNKLNQLIQNPEKNKEILEIYYLCLSLGFQGKYLLENPQQREIIISKLAKTIIKTTKSFNSLSPHGLPDIPAQKALGVKRYSPIPLWVTVSLLALLISVFWIILNFVCGIKADFKF